PALAADVAGQLYVVGTSVSSNYPTVAGSFDTTSNGGRDVVVTKLATGGGSLAWSTYLGGAQDDDGIGLALDAALSVYVTGQTRSGNFPTTPGAFQPAKNGPSDAFVTKLTTGGVLLYSTFLGGSADDVGRSIVVDAATNAYVTGESFSN